MPTFDSHPRAVYWSKRNDLKPNNVSLNSHKSFWFDCPDCGHEFEKKLLNINQANSWCPYCSKPSRKLCENESCELCFQKSFASSNKALYWSSENLISPRKVFKSEDRVKRKFNCDCGHFFFIDLKSISSSGHWCSYCSHQKLCENTECRMCFNNSFASVERSKFLSNKSFNPRQLFKSTNKKFLFDCDLCYKPFSTQLSDITKGVWCPHCPNKTEQIVFDKVVKTYVTLQRQYKVDWCKNKKHLPFDFVIEEGKVIIELDGKQHFEQIGNWPTPKDTQKNDLYKMKCANEHGYSVIRIMQKDVYKNTYDWLFELCENIEKIALESRVQNIYMCKNNEYKDFVF